MAGHGQLKFVMTEDTNSLDGAQILLTLIRNTKTNKNVQEMNTDIIVNNNADAKMYSFIFSEDI